MPVRTARPPFLLLIEPEYFLTPIRLGMELQAHKGVVKHEKRTGFAIHNYTYCRLEAHNRDLPFTSLSFFFLLTFNISNKCQLELGFGCFLTLRRDDRTGFQS